MIAGFALPGKVGGDTQSRLFDRADPPVSITLGLLLITELLDDRHDLFIGDEASSAP